MSATTKSKVLVFKIPPFTVREPGNLLPSVVDMLPAFPCIQCPGISRNYVMY